MDALKRAEQAKSRGNSSVSLPIASEALPLLKKTESTDSKKEELMLESTTTDSPVVEVELDFTMEGVEPLPDKEASGELSLANDLTALAVEPLLEVKKTERPSIEKNLKTEQKEENKSKNDSGKEFITPLTTDKSSETPPQISNDKDTVSIKVLPDRPQVPMMIGKPRFNRSYIWGGLLLVCFVIGIGYYIQALNSVNSENMAASPVVNSSDVDISSGTVEDLSGAVEETQTDKSVVTQNVVLPAVKKNDRPVADVVALKSVANHSGSAESSDQAAPPLVNKKHNSTLTPQVEAVASLKQSSLQIDKAVVSDPLQELLQSAYNAYESGDLSSASEFYRQIQRRESDNRDALLGLAVIAQHQGNLDSARGFYEKLLILNPKDSVAASGIVSLNNGSVTTQGISRLKLLLQEEPTAAHLHFFLANEYAAQSRWPEAQQAYFQAYHYAPAQADYAFNLAVSLEKVGQTKIALEYYRRALIASDKSASSFDRQQLIERIDTLTARQ